MNNEEDIVRGACEMLLSSAAFAAFIRRVSAIACSCTCTAFILLSSTFVRAIRVLRCKSSRLSLWCSARRRDHCCARQALARCSLSRARGCLVGLATDGVSGLIAGRLVDGAGGRNFLLQNSCSDLPRCIRKEARDWMTWEPNGPKEAFPHEALPWIVSPPDEQGLDICGRFA